MQKRLHTADHTRNVSGLRYVYPVVSRRAGGVSIGINLNTNNACNWRCVYCSVPNLIRGKPEPIDLALLKTELSDFLHDVVHGDFMQQYVKEADRQLQDIAFAGNGEPTSAQAFPSALSIVQQVLHDAKLAQPIKTRVITNGSQMHQASVLSALAQLAKHHGEVWFKLDAGTSAGMQAINDIHINVETHLNKLKRCATVCPTYIQTCLFGMDAPRLNEAAINAYIAQVCTVKSYIKGVHLYGIARQAMQPEAKRLRRLSKASLETVADRMREHDIKVYVNA